MSTETKKLAEERCYGAALEAIRQFIQKPTGKTMSRVVSEIRKEATYNEPPRKCFGDQTNGAICDFLGKLQSHQEAPWAEFLSGIRDEHDFNMLKQVSPFTGRIAITVEYGCGFVHFRGDLKLLMDWIIATGHNLKVGDGDKYLVLMPPTDLKKTKVIWVGGGDGKPRPADAPCHLTATDMDEGDV